MSNPFHRALDDELRGEQVRVVANDGAVYSGWVERIHHQQRHVLLRSATRRGPDGGVDEPLGSTFIAHAEAIEVVAPSEIQSVPLDQVQPAPYHAREFDPLENGAYIASVRDDGWAGSYPVVRYTGDGTQYEILEGHKRLWVAEQAGLRSHPVEIVDDVDDWAALRWFVDDHFPDPDQVDDDGATTASGYYDARQIETAVEAMARQWGDRILELDRVRWNVERLGAELDFSANIEEERSASGGESAHADPTSEPDDGGHEQVSTGPIPAVERVGYAAVDATAYPLPKRLRTLDHRDPEALAWAYERTESIAEAAEHFDVQAQTIRRRLKEADIHTPDDGSQATASEQVVTALAEHGESSGSDITLITGLRDATVYSALRDLRDDGRIEARQDPDDGRRKLYSLAESEHEIGDPIEDTTDAADDEDMTRDDAALDAKLPDGVGAHDVEGAVDEHGPNAPIEAVAEELGLAVDTTRRVCLLTGVYGDVREGARMRGGAE